MFKEFLCIIFIQARIGASLNFLNVKTFSGSGSHCFIFLAKANVRLFDKKSGMFGQGYYCHSVFSPSVICLIYYTVYNRCNTICLA